MAIKHLKPRSKKELSKLTPLEKIENFIYDMDDKYESNMQIYFLMGNMPKAEKLYKLIQKGYDMKAIVWSSDDDDEDEDREERFSVSKKWKNKNIKPWIEKGWKLFHHEDNMDSGEFILVKSPLIKEELEDSSTGIKKPYSTLHNIPGVGNPRPAGIVREDAMGGVSAPMATLNNTPGMGNIVPAGTNTFGSGDKFGNTIGGKPYTQARTPKRKKKKAVVKTKKVKSPLGTPKLEEENINPYDKIGTMMAKKAKVPMTFKKKKSKSNQNSMVQKKFEHEIITFDEFKKLME